MATFISVKKAGKFPEIIKKFRRQGGNALAKKVKGGASYARVAPGTGTSRQNAQLDVTSVTGVPALKKNGKK